MLISPKVQKIFWGIKPEGVLHVGAHLAEEKSQYDSLGFGNIYWVEANPELCTKLRNITNDKVYQGLVWSETGLDRPFYLGENTAVSSTFAPDLVADLYPSFHFNSQLVIKTTTLNDLLPQACQFNYVNLDIQGAELHALRGMDTFLNKVKYIYSEVSIVNLYSGSALLQELAQHLKEQGFKMVALRMVSGKGWGEAFFMRVSDLGIVRRIQINTGTALYQLIGLFGRFNDFFNRAIGFIAYRIRTKFDF